MRTARRYRLLAALLGGVLALSACADDGSSPSLPGQADTSAYDAIIAGSPVADPAAITAGSWADKIKQRGVLNVGGVDAGPLFALKDPATGKVTGFDAGLSQMLAHYITGKATDNTNLTITTVDTRESLLQNNTVDAVFATYTITPQRATKVAFAGPYYESGDSIMVKADNTTINAVADLNGRTVATEANSTAVLALQKNAPGAKPLLFQEDAQCVAAVQQGRADAYVLDQGILISDASTNPQVKVVGAPFTKEPYGIGLPLSDPTAKAFVNAWLQKIYTDGTWAKLWKATIGTVVKGDPPATPTIGSAEGS